MGLSNNVMNMKFMQKAQDRKKDDVPKPEGKKVKDTSEWSLPAGAFKHVKPAVAVRTVGYGSIASLTAEDKESDEEGSSVPETQPVPASVPAAKPEINVCSSYEATKTGTSTNIQNTAKDDAEKFLSGILNKAQKSKDKKRPLKDSKHLRKKARTLLS